MVQFSDAIKTGEDLDRRFNIMYRRPKEDMVSVLITKNDITIHPTSGTRDLSLKSWEKAKLFGVLLKVDKLRMLSDTISMYIHVPQAGPATLYHLRLADADATFLPRQMVCTECGLRDAVIYYNKPVKELLDKNWGLETYTAKVPGSPDMYDFTFIDIQEIKRRFNKDEKPAHFVDHFFSYLQDMIDSFSHDFHL